VATKRGSLQVLSADKLIEQIASAMNCDEAIEKALDAGADEAEALMKPSLQSVLSAKHRNGELVNALGKTKVRKDWNDNHNIKVGFSEPRSDGGINAKIANILEHGRSDDVQPPRPWLKPIKKQIEINAVDAISKKFDEELKKKL